MKIGYPCLNLTLDCTSSRTFRLKSYSKERLKETVEGNLDCLERTLEFNLEHGILFFRITSDLVPFASHPLCDFDWQNYFSERFSEIGRFIRENKMRISTHPDQFIVLNSDKGDVVRRSVKELEYHSDFMDLMGLDRSAKIQLHVGGVYGNKGKAMDRFARNYGDLKQKVKNRLVIENDERSYGIEDCLCLSERIDIPVIFDYLHHRVNGNGEVFEEIIPEVEKTWKKKDGVMMVDYSSQEPGERPGKHAETVDLKDFKEFLSKTEGHDMDIMLEIKDKEKSALKALEAASGDPRLVAERI